MHSPIQTYRNPNQLHIIASECQECKNVIFPYQKHCTQCLNIDPDKFSTINLPQTGKIYSYTTIHKPPTQFKKYTPYHVAIIQLDTKSDLPTIRLTGQIVDTHKPLTIGQTVTSVYRILHSDDPAGHIHYGIKWQTHTE